MKTLSKSRIEEQQTHPELGAPKLKRCLKWCQDAFLFAAYLTVGILALETLMQASGVGMEEFLEPDPVLGVRHIAGKKVVWRMEGYSDETINSDGMRDVERTIHKPDGLLRVALLGDSATEGLQVALPNTYGQFLETALSRSLKRKVEVLNFGCSSYSTGQEYLQIRRQIAPYKPDVVVLMYNRGDLLENFRDPANLKVEARPYFYFDDKGKLAVDNAVMELNKEKFRPNDCLDFLRRNSAIYGALSHLNLTLQLNEKLYLKMRSLYSSIVEGRTGKFKVSKPHPVPPAWDLTAALLSATRSDSAKIGADFVIVSFPNIVNDKDYASQISRIDDLAKKEGFRFVDLTPCFQGHQDPAALFVQYHFSGAGHEMAANKIAPPVESALSAKLWAKTSASLSKN